MREEREAGTDVGPLGAWPTVSSGLPGLPRNRIVGLCVYAILTTAAFVQPLVALMRHAAAFDLHSHIPLVPLVVAYLLYLEQGSRTSVYRTSVRGAVLLGVFAMGAVAAALWWRGTLSANDYLTLTTLSFVSAVAAGGFLFLGTQWMGSRAFAFSFLLFMIPMPDGMTNAFEVASMLASADVAAWLLTVTGTPLVRDGQVFALPGIVLQVAQECSGIRSSWVLFITSGLASHLFLNSRWRQLTLVAFVIPLGVVRNGFRILIIGLLCVHVGPEMIDSPIHHQGGPLFFVMSLAPLTLFLWWLRRREH